MPNIVRTLRTFQRAAARPTLMEYSTNSKNIVPQATVLRTKNENFIIEQAKSEDIGRIVDFFTEIFTFTEPHNRAIGFTRDDARPLLTMIAESSIPHGLSCLVTEERSKELVGTRLWGIASRDDPLTVPMPSLPRRSQLIVDILAKCKEGFWEKVDPSVHRVVSREITAVTPKHMGKGIATFLVSHMLDKDTIRQLDVQGIMSEATSIQNQRLLRKAGYEVYNEVKHEEYLDEEGRRIFQCDDGTDRVVLFFKKL